MSIARSVAVAALATVALAAPAVAHPHVWVTTKAVILYGEGGRIAAIRHLWTFDDAYSAYAVQGFEAGPDGKPKPEKLAELAKLNVESLADSRYFTYAKANGQKLAFADPMNPAVTFDEGRITLSFDLPLTAPAKADRAFTLEVYDPTFFVDFAIAEGAEAVRLQGAPKGCALNVTRPKPPDPAQTAGLGESFFSALNASANYGAQFTSRILVACP